MNAAFIKSLEKKRACAHGVDCSTIKSEADKSVAHWRKLPGKVYAEMRNLAALDSLLEPGHRKAKVKAETDLKARVKKQAPWTPEEQHILENTKANHERPHTYNMCACIHAWVHVHSNVCVHRCVHVFSLLYLCSLGEERI